MKKLSRYYWTAKGVGWNNLHRRMLQAVRVRNGHLADRLSPENFCDEEYRESLKSAGDWLARRKKFFTRPGEVELKRLAGSDLWQEKVSAVVNNILAGDYIYFSKWYARAGWPVDFNHDPVNDVRWPVGEHWLEGDSLGGSDIKILWEPNRFAAAFYFARQFARTGDMKYSEAFWELFDAWVQQNPPELTRNWSCGQENVFRLMAMLFGAMATLGTPYASEKRLDTLARLAWQTAKHVSININYARSQGNNHAISEAAGLVTVGLLFDEFRESKKWLKDGLAVLTAEVSRQEADYGSYAQNSMSYHRLVLDDLLWVFGLLEKSGAAIPKKLESKFEAMTCWLAEMVSSAVGEVPNYGANDGANILPLSCTDYNDYRPVLQACWWRMKKENLFGPGPWDEKKLWLVGEDSLAESPTAYRHGPSFAARDGGYYLLRGPHSRFFTRCHTYKSRPNQNDMLHADVWYKGKNILRDAGSYSYNSPQPWGSYFNSTAAHNTIVINDADQMIKGPRFLWFEWTKSRLIRFDDDVFIGEHYGYKKRFGAVHRRSCVRHGDAYVIIDELTGPGSADVKMLWRLADGAWAQTDSAKENALKIENDGMIIEVCAGGLDATLRAKPVEDDPAGWESRYYGRKNFCPHVMISGGAALPVKIVTLVCPAVEHESLPPVKEILSQHGIRIEELKCCKNT